MRKILLLLVLLFAGGVMAMEILEAKVGLGDSWLDVTEVFKKAKVTDDFYCGWFHGASMAGQDPAPGKVKQIVVKYKDDDGSTQTRILAEKAFAAVAANTPGPTEKFTFGRAFWGDKDKFVEVKAGTKSIKLNATANTGMPVEYFVVHGPAFLQDGELIFTEIPPGAKYPVEIAVTAWQYGSWNEPKLQTAEPVTRRFHLVK